VKAPYGFVLRQVGEGHVVEQALELLIDEQYPEILKEAEIEPFGPGTLEKVAEIDPPTFEFIVPLDPVVELGDYKAIKVPYELPVIGDDEVDQVIEQAREQHGIREKVDRPAEMGDIVYMRISGRLVDEGDGESETIIEERFSSSIIQEAEEAEFPFPGFGLDLIGLSAEEEKTIPYQYPEDFDDDSLKGRNVEFEITVTNIQSIKLPDIDDNLALEASEFDTLEAWRVDLKKSLEEDALEGYAEEYDDLVIDQVVDGSTIKFPPQMVENETENILRSLDLRLSQQGLTKALYLQIRGMDEDSLSEEITPVAEERVKRFLVLFEIAREEEIKIDENKVKDETGRTIDAISQSMTPNEAKKFAQSDYITGLITNIAADMTTQTTMEFLRATAKGEPWPPEEKELKGAIEEVPTHDDDVESLDVDKESEVETDSQPEETLPKEAPDDEKDVKEIEPGVVESETDNDDDDPNLEENNKSKEK
jgi:trigger factor